MSCGGRIFFVQNDMRKSNGVIYRYNHMML